MLINRNVFACLLLLCCHFISFGQDTTYQRIMAAKDDTAKVVELFKYAKSFLHTEPEKSQQANRKLITLSQQLNYPYWTGMAYMDIAYAYAAKGDETAAIENYKNALSYLRKANDTATIAKCLLNLGNCVEGTGDYTESIKLALEAIHLLEPTKYRAQLARAYTSIGIIFYNIDNHDKSIEYLQKALPLVKELKDTAQAIKVFYALSAALSSENKIKEGIAYAEQAIQLAQALGKKAELHLAHQSMAELLAKAEQGQKAVEHAKLSLQYAEADGHMHYILPATMIVAEAYGKTNNPRQQVHYLQQARAISEENQIALELSLIYKGLSEAHEKMGQYKEGLNFYKKYIVFRDSTEGEKTKKHIAELEVQYRAAEKEKTITQKNLEVTQKNLQLQKSKQISLFSIGATAVALLAALLIYLHFRNKRKQHQQQLQTIKQEKEIQLLQALMQGEEKERSRIAKDLHDGVAGMLAATKMHFNSLSAQYPVLTDADTFKKSVQLLDDAFSEVRKTSHNLMPEVLTQYGLDEALRRYCSNINNSKTLTIQYDSLGVINRYMDSFELSVYRIVQELLTNIIKHSKATEALVQVSQQHNLLSITIEDNGIGFDNKKKEGMGLQGLHSRVRAMNGKFQMDVETGGGVCAYLEFDVSRLEKEPAYAVN